MSKVSETDMPPQTIGPAAAPPYGHVAWVYDALASMYSLGAIDRAKRVHLQRLKPGDQVLYAGAGRGREIIGACQRGAEVTCIEPCPVMGTHLSKRLTQHAERVDIDRRPIQEVPAEPVYDLVVAHFFLNVFDAATMLGVLEHLCGFVKPGGRLVIADFKPAASDAGAIDRARRTLYYRPINLAGRLLGICALHPIYDYGPLLTERGFEIESRQAVRSLPGLPPLYEAISAIRKTQ